MTESLQNKRQVAKSSKKEAGGAKKRVFLCVFFAQSAYKIILILFYFFFADIGLYIASQKNSHHFLNSGHSFQNEPLFLENRKHSVKKHP